MSTARRVPLALAFALLLGAAAACNEEGTTVGPPELINPVGTWYLHAVDDSALSALASDRAVGVAREWTIVDSARLVVTPGGSYQQQIFNRILLQGNLDRVERIVDLGSWLIVGDSIVFTSETLDRSFLVTGGLSGSLLTNEAFATYIGAPRNVGRYRKTPP